MNIEHITCESGDWEVLKVDGRIYHDGNTIPTHIWKDLLSKNNLVASKEISDEDMDDGNY